MRTLLPFLSFFIILFFTTNSHAQTVTANAHNMFEIADESLKLTPDLRGHIIYKRTPGSRIQVEVAIEAGFANKKLLDFLVDQGRYEIEIIEDRINKEIILRQKNMNNAVVIKGEECEEILVYTIYLPDNVTASHALSVVD